MANTIKNILVVEDDQSARIALSKAITKPGLNILQAPTGEKAIEIAEKEPIHLAFCDIKLPGMDGMEVLMKLKHIQPESLVVMMTAWGSIEVAVKAIKMGALDFLEKPISDLNLLRQIIETALKLPEHLKNREALIQEIQNQKGFAGMIGISRAMQEVFATIIKVAPARTTVLITGETGTGKELAARAIHQYSNRDGAFIPVNFSAVTDTLFESELFGYVKGAHSTAFQSRKGRLEEANQGTLFIDEVGDIPENLQTKLLRCIETRTFERLGENTSQKVDVRFVAATNVDLEQAVADGKFREDLYYRLKVFRIHLPPLREHTEDIPLLVQHYLHILSKENQRPLCRISKEGLDLLMGYSWPGNIRELRSKLEQAMIMADSDTLLPQHFAEEIQKAKLTETGDVIQLKIGSSLRDAERELIQRTLAKVNGNKTKAAEILGIGTRTLYRKIEEYNLQ